MNQIPMIQNQDSQLKLLRARTRTYGLASRLMLSQLLLTVTLPVLGAAASIIKPGIKPYVAAISLMVIVLDILFFDRYQKVLTKRAARLGEQFDCTVLELPWNPFIVGDRVEAEDIHSAAKAYSTHHDDKALRGWYPEAIGALPLHLARIVCQRTNLRYDSKLRRSFGSIIRISSFCLVIALVVSGFVQDLSMTSWVLTMAPATPILSWAGREYYRQFDTAEILEGLMKESKKVWADALAGKCDADQCLSTSREFQDAIYNRRANSPLVLPLLYRLKRSDLEDEMNQGAEAFIEDYKNSLR